MTDDEKLATNERTKVTATFLNNVAVAVIATGLVAPFFAMLYGMSNLPPEQIRFSGLAAPGWVMIGCDIHYMVRGYLGGLRS